ncbi:hypothetical protein [Actinocorallia longicatena]|uniref:Uncharacterized protein n=1 Tax=Actinocorallia longicatena TaxID=111803 RepID=A0ABP6Q8H6_9ACTN
MTQTGLPPATGRHRRERDEPAGREAAEMTKDLETLLEDIDAMFVQNAHGLTVKEGVVALHEPSPSTLYFADRPERVVGHVHTETFVDLWDEGENSFAEDPPNAVLSFSEPGMAALGDVVVVLSEPILDAGTLQYTVEVLDGELPPVAGPCVLFIDPFGRPLSPTSASGVARRPRRRFSGSGRPR